MSQPVESGYAPARGLDLYWESRGQGGPPLVVMSGGFAAISLFTGLLDELAATRQVVAIELQAHGHTRDVNRPFTWEGFGDDIAAVIGHLALGPADLLGDSLGGSACLRAAIQHPDIVRRLAVVSIPCRRTGWFPEVLAGMDQVGAALAEGMAGSPMHQAWQQAAPEGQSFATLAERTGALLRQPYDWTTEVGHLSMPTLLVYGDADSIPPAHAAEFFALIGGGLRDPGWDGALPSPNRLAILPGRTHYDVFSSPELTATVTAFFA